MLRYFNQSQLQLGHWYKSQCQCYSQQPSLSKLSIRWIYYLEAVHNDVTLFLTKLRKREKIQRRESERAIVALYDSSKSCCMSCNKRNRFNFEVETFYYFMR